MGSQGSSSPVTIITDELTWDHQVDVVVVGTGIAGCSTAFNTLEQGATVLMLEKGETTGGTSAKAGGRHPRTEQSVSSETWPGRSPGGFHPLSGPGGSSAPL
jgi:choline dehydrogenase-like flavoprotein